MPKQPDYEEVHRYDLAHAVFRDVFGGPLRDGCFKISIAGTMDLAALRRIRQHLDIAIGFFEDDERALRPAPPEGAPATTGEG